MKKLFMFVIIFLLIGGYLIKTNYNLDFKSNEDKQTFIREFASWIIHLANNIRQITGGTTSMNWLPENNSKK